MKLILLFAAFLIFTALLFHCFMTRPWRWSILFTVCALFFGLWHELNPLRESDPEYFFAQAVTIGGVPVVGVFGWMIVIYLSWFMVETLWPGLLRTRVLIFPPLVFALAAALFALCIETTGIGMGWWIWREDRQHILFPMGGWATQTVLFSSIFFALFHSTFKTKVLFLALMIPMGLTFLESLDRTIFAEVIRGAGILAFVVFARFDPRSWKKRSAF